MVSYALTAVSQTSLLRSHSATQGHRRILTLLHWGLLIHFLRELLPCPPYHAHHHVLLPPARVSTYHVPYSTSRHYIIVISNYFTLPFFPFTF